VSTVVVSTALAAGLCIRRPPTFAFEAGFDQGCRRLPKTKYEIGRTPAELMSAAAAAHIRFRHRIWLAGRRLMSMSAAARRAAATVRTANGSRWCVTSTARHPSRDDGSYQRTALGGSG